MNPAQVNAGEFGPEDNSLIPINRSTVTAVHPDLLSRPSSELSLRNVYRQAMGEYLTPIYLSEISNNINDQIHLVILSDPPNPLPTTVWNLVYPLAIYEFKRLRFDGTGFFDRVYPTAGKIL